jgi:ferric-dicitrate binding protein FerR (iron transport regulator)
MTREELLILVEKVLAGTASDEELLKYNRIYNKLLSQERDRPGMVLPDEADIKQTIYQRILERTSTPKGRIIPTWSNWAAAAAILLLLGLSFYLITRKPANLQLTQQERFKNDIPAPAGNNAILTLANGQQIVLDTASGILATQGNISISKQMNGQLVYSGMDDEAGMNFLQLPRGSRPLSVRLADGSRVWLDAASSLRYPMAFTGEERKVEISGQAYFEIMPNSAAPFRITNLNDNTTVEVLGTDFNIRAFPGENATKVTLVEGAVRVKSGQASQFLRPGQQATSANGNIRLAQHVNIDEVVSWKNNLFYYDGKDIRTIMADLERYYNIEVNYQDNVNDSFVAKIPRDVPVSQLLGLLELTNLVHFKIEGRKIVVMK